MKRLLALVAAGISANAFFAFAALAQATPEVALTRFADCGTPQAPTAVNQRFSDTYAFGDLKVQFVFSCYLIKHGVGISHFHADHTGQVASFPKATVLIGKGDWDAIANPAPAQGVNAAPFAAWIKGEGKVEPLANDKDVFGDGSVIVLNTPGHTPGHHSVLVKLAQTGAVLISGDAVHFRENYDTNGVPWFNFDRAQSLASIDRLKKIAVNAKATVIIQHDARDIDKLPAFPASAK
jgi:N-acyl homoserine lactone hydrolase